MANQKSKARVIERYRDKYTKDIHEIGEIVSLAAKRLGELESKGFVRAIKEDKPEEKDIEE